MYLGCESFNMTAPAEQEAVERVARAMFDQDHEEGWARGEQFTKDIYLANAEAALGAIPISDYIDKAAAFDQLKFSRQRAARQAAEATREACLRAKGDWDFRGLARDISDDYAVGLRRGLEDWDKAIRALDITKITEAGE
jgi:hypothetical protein